MGRKCPYGKKLYDQAAGSNELPIHCGCQMSGGNYHPCARCQSDGVDAKCLECLPGSEMDETTGMCVFPPDVNSVNYVDAYPELACRNGHTTVDDSTRCQNIARMVNLEMGQRFVGQKGCSLVIDYGDNRGGVYVNFQTDSDTQPSSYQAPLRVEPVCYNPMEFKLKWSLHDFKLSPEALAALAPKGVKQAEKVKAPVKVKRVYRTTP